MATQRETVVYTEDKPSKVVKLKVSEGSALAVGNKIVVFEYLEDESQNEEKTTSSNGSNSNNRQQHFIRANSIGVVKNVFIKPGDTLFKK